MDLQLSDLTATYPDFRPEGTEVQTVISRKKEFDDLRSGRREKLKMSRGSFFNHQLAFERYMRFNDNAFIVHKPGTGKSCTITAVTEHFRKNEGRISHVVILAAGKTQKNEMKRQIVCACTPEGTYDTAKVNSSDSMETQKKRVTAEIKKWYTITTMGTFVNTINREYPPGEEEAMKKDYARTLFVIDEVQFLRISAGKKAKGETETAESRKLNVFEDDKKKSGVARLDVYTTLWKLFHTALDPKVILATATPMVDNVEELAPHLNLILPLELQIPVGSQLGEALRKTCEESGIVIPPPLHSLRYDNLGTAPMEELMKVLQGRVSYVGTQETGVRSVFIGEELPGYSYKESGGKPRREVVSHMVLDKSILGPLQERAYVKSGGPVDDPGRTVELDSGAQEKSGAKNDIYNSVRQCLNFVYPDGSIGRDGYQKFITHDQMKFPQANDELLRWLRGDGREVTEDGLPVRLSSLSVKYDKIVESAIRGLSLRERLFIDRLGGDDPLKMAGEYAALIPRLTLFDLSKDLPEAADRQLRAIEAFVEKNRATDFSVVISYSLAGLISVKDEHLYNDKLDGHDNLEQLISSLMDKVDDLGDRIWPKQEDAFHYELGLASLKANVRRGQKSKAAERSSQKALSLLGKSDSSLGAIASELGISIPYLAGRLGLQAFDLFHIAKSLKSELEIRSDAFGAPFDIEQPLNSLESGKRYVYSHYVTASGAETIGLCLQARGFERFVEGQSVFTSDRSSVRPYCASGGGARVGNFTKRPRYAIIRGGDTVTDKSSDAIFELFNSESNIDGEYIKIIILSPVGQVGINLSGIMNVDIDSPEWTPGSVYQARERAFRVVSHKSLIERKRKQLLEEGIVIENPILDVRVHYHACYLRRRSESGSLIDLGTLEVRMYRVIEIKDIMISQLMRRLKRSAFDCLLHLERNINRKDKDYSPSCDYDVCAYNCFEEEPAPGERGSDVSTYDVYFYDEIVDRHLSAIAGYFKMRSSGRIEDIRDFYEKTHGKPTRDRYLYYTLEHHLIGTETALSNTFGFRAYLFEEGGVFYVSRSLPRENRFDGYSSSFYNSALIATQKKDLKAVSEMINRTRVTVDMERTLTLDREGRRSEDHYYEVRDAVGQMSAVDKAALLENSIAAFVGGHLKQDDSPLFRIFTGSYFAFREPVGAIRFNSESLANKDKRRKRRTMTAEDYQKTGDLVYLHILDVLLPKDVEHASMNSYLNVKGNVRLYRPADRAWRDATEAELPAYQMLISEKIKENMKPFEENQDGFYGIFLRGYFKISDNRRLSSEVTDLRLKRRGMNCSSVPTGLVLDMIYALQMNPLTDRPIDTRDRMISLIASRTGYKKAEIEQWESGKVEFFFRWLTANLNSSDRCELLAKQMVIEGLAYSAMGTAEDNYRDLFDDIIQYEE